ncbi:hypothetical protein [Niallia sp. 03091]|uniref:hypothetical protein n=1 Tax=Niallia sp. 03091 TaxID=3458059 RepID=UPI004044E745
MEIIIDELVRSQRYHQRQLDENIQQIRNKEESIAVLKNANETHIKVLNELGQFIDKLKSEDKT